MHNIIGEVHARMAARAKQHLRRRDPGLVRARRLFLGRIEMPDQSGRCHADPVYFLLHIPKTAGQTVQLHLAEHCAPGVFWKSYSRVRLERSASAYNLSDLRRARVIAGHYITRSFEKLFPGREIRRVVLLREPIEFQVSYYNWRMMDNIAKGLGTYSFDLHFRALQRNFMAEFLLSHWLEIPRALLMVMSEEKKFDHLNRMLAGFWFVGAHSDCDRLIAQIGPDLGVPATARRRNTAAELQAQTGWRPLTSDSLTLAMRQAIRARHRLDQALWDNWRGAGFNPASIRPSALDRGEKTRFSTREIVRPWFKLRQLAVRQGGAWPGTVKAGAAKFTEADRARDAGHWELAARRYREALRILPKGPAIWVQYGHAMKAVGKVAEAENAYREALRLNPVSADTHLQLGHVLKLQGRGDKAEEAYRRSVLLNPTGCDARRELIGLGWTMERLEKTIADAREGRF